MGARAVTASPGRSACFECPELPGRRHRTGATRSIGQRRAQLSLIWIAECVIEIIGHRAARNGHAGGIDACWPGEKPSV